MHLDFKHIAIGLFFMTTFIIGLYAGRNIKTLKDYAIANRSYGLPVLVMTCIATMFGGSAILASPSNVFKEGIWQFIDTLIGIPTSALFVAYFIGPKIKYFKDCLTIGDISNRIYGRNYQILTGIINTFFSIFFLAAQILAMGKVCQTLLNINFIYSVYFGGIIIVLYSTFGGIRSIAITDVLQFIASLIVVLLILNKVLEKTGGVFNVFTEISSKYPEKFRLSNIHSLPNYIAVLIVWCMFPTLFISPPFIQRMLMAKNDNQIKKMLVFSTLIQVFIKGTIAIIALSACVLFSNNIGSSLVVPKIIKTFFDFKMQILLSMGILSIIMSTADSYLNSVGIIVSNDILRPLLNKKVEDLNLNFVKLTTFIIGMISIIIASISFNIYKMIFYACAILSLITIPLCAGIMGLKVSKREFFVSFITSVFTFVILIIIFPKHSDIVILASIIVNGLSFFITNYFNNKGFIMIKRKNDEIKEELWNPLAIRTIWSNSSN